MAREQEFIDRLATFALDPAARGLRDDAAVLRCGAHDLVLTHDMIVEGVHYRPGDDPADVAWKLVAVNLSDLAAKGARPVGLLVGYPLAAEAAWDRAFADGLGRATAEMGVPLLGGDTVRVPAGAARQIGATALGRVAPGAAPSRAGARPGDALFVTGTIGAAALGLAALERGEHAPADWIAAYLRPVPRLAAGRALAPLVHAMADVSDGLLLDAQRMARASGLAVEIALEAVPLAPGAPGGQAGAIAAATGGDDYELLCAATGLTVSQPAFGRLSEVGRFTRGAGLTLTWHGAPVPLPDRLGYEHGEG